MNIILSIGDPNGIGIEILAKALLKTQNNDNLSKISFSISANKNILSEYLNKIGIPATVENKKLYLGKKLYSILNCEYYYPIKLGFESANAGKAASESIENALQQTIAGHFDAFVTMPISKSAVYKAGWKFPGHTEMLANACNINNPLMILCTRSIRVALATVHISIDKVARNLSINSVQSILTTFNNSLRNDYNINQPKIAVLGLNPHAGESGAIGKEETEIIIPAIEMCKINGISADGPHPADGFFAHNAYQNYDGILAMYHDQGLIPLKMLAKGAGVNFTAGLPIVRTSPDHGTAFAIAGKNLADETSALEAICLAVDVVNNRRNVENV